MSPRVGLIGARRARQGLGPFVARDLLAAGAEIPCLLGTSADSAALAADDLRAHGIEPRPYVDLAEMLEKEPLDALAILSPSATHETYLEAAARAGLHALCEKPFIWGGDGLVDRTRYCVDAFRERRLLLVENCQWPHTLEAFRALHPVWSGAPPERFGMHLSPASSGEELLGDCLPHPLSLLQALAPAADATVESVRYELRARDASRVALEFDYRAGTHRIAVALAFEATEELPREAGYAIDGLRAERRVELPDYTLALADGGRQVALSDPLTTLVRGFVAQLREPNRSEKHPYPASIAQRMSLIAALLDSYRAQVDAPGV